MEVIGDQNEQERVLLGKVKNPVKRPSNNMKFCGGVYNTEKYVHQKSAQLEKVGKPAWAGF